MIIQVSPPGSMDLLSQLEVERLKKTASSDLTNFIAIAALPC